MTLTNVVRTIFYHLRNGPKIVRTTFVRVIVTLADMSLVICKMFCDYIYNLHARVQAKYL